LDAAAFAPTHPLDLTAVPADFVCISFYKLFGWPTGIGALVVRKEDAGSFLRKARRLPHAPACQHRAAGAPAGLNGPRALPAEVLWWGQHVTGDQVRAACPAATQPRGVIALMGSTRGRGRLRGRRRRVLLSKALVPVL
jgi:hypothetical protein